MAIDLWLLEQHLLGVHPPTLRFYTWSPPAISLGYHQRRYPEFWQNLTWQGQPIDLVRRPTGGRAVLHQGDLTYAVITSGIKGTRTEVYEYICQFIIQGWRNLGVDLHYGMAGKGYIHNPNCFGTATGADLVCADGTKLVGSAQLRRGDAVLQHGSMSLNPDLDLLSQVFGESTLLPLTGLKIQGEELRLSAVEALTEAASECFGVELVVQPLSEAEMSEIAKVM
ncbi:lipoate--protein ligase family protein [Merismopedia glauca]|uniref:Biotin--protein ligase n=1 Tax=Merismopedia glauca CCAP 1448/3 TaxID=1296344 RepID=A0A2T1C9H7_9CYAN|nr:biotin/lipoate A/B protein ligase family protein [Merismopedia glauca]PSB04793.1 biotin--protein ligase [Merismopedia glauca CCAP 1448/3]